MHKDSDILEKVKLLFSTTASITDVDRLPALKPFDKNVCEFFHEFSRLALHDARAKRFPDIVTFAFFCRKGSLQSIREKYGELEGRVGRGISFHIAPSNVPINFAYSMVAGILAGNAVIVRTSSKEFEQTDILCRLLEKTSKITANHVGDYLKVISYEHDVRITDCLSQLSDVRIIWGGDHTIANIRKSPLKARAFDITFADRFSLCVLNAKEVLKIEDMSKTAHDFYNDTYLYDQNACSSPRLLYWIGNKEDCANAQAKFWGAILEKISGNYAVEAVTAINKTMTDYKCALEFDGAEIIAENNFIHRIQLHKLRPNLHLYTCAGGSFLEYASESMEELAQIVDSRYQTMSYLKCDAGELRDWVVRHGLRGIDRIVPMGKTSDFSLVWDGTDLILALSRICYCE